MCVRILAGVEVQSHSRPDARVVGALAKGIVIEVVAREGVWVRTKNPSRLRCRLCQHPAATCTGNTVATGEHPCHTPPSLQHRRRPLGIVADTPQCEGFWIGLGLRYGPEGLW